MMEYPTAMQEDVDTHDTERNLSSNADAFGLSTTVQELPSQTSIKVSVAEPVSVLPTATHHAVDTQDTERNSSFLPPATGLSTTVQELPSQTSINVSVAESVRVEPTATHHAADTHDTERRKSLTVPDVGLPTTVQELPSQTSIKVCVPESVSVEPTATHHTVDTHETDERELEPVSALGLGTTVIVSIAAPAGDEITTEPNRSAETATTPDSHVRTIRDPQRTFELLSPNNFTTLLPRGRCFELHTNSLLARPTSKPVARFRSI